MDARTVLKDAGRVVHMARLASGDVFYIVTVEGDTVTVLHSGVVERIDPNPGNKGGHNGPLPIGRYHGATNVMDLYPDTFGFGELDVEGRMFLALTSLEPVEGVTFRDERPAHEKQLHELKLPNAA